VTSPDAYDTHQDTSAVGSARPLRTADMVMKGGVTSGVVYPKAIARLATRFQFKNIGGTSAGAIAAAVAAAAEFRRKKTGEAAGFDEMAHLPDWLGASPACSKNSNLFHLFQPVRATEKIFKVLTSALGDDPGLTAFYKLLTTSVRCYPKHAGFGAAIMLLSQLVIRGSTLPFHIGNVLLGLFSIGAGTVLGSAFGLLREFVCELPRNRFGICSGMPRRKGSGSGEQPVSLTPWLHGLINRVAGRREGDQPLTFGDLWEAGEVQGVIGARAINLEMMTTNLTHQRPYRLPFRFDTELSENQLFYFRQREFRRLFPSVVVDWMLAHPRDCGSNPKRIARRKLMAKSDFFPMPDGRDLPVVVATRMSLSFPVLLSAIPLHAFDYRLGHKAPRPEKCWFSDGGLCCNFPIHFFDSALPRRPTLSMDLEYVPKDTPPEALKPTMPKQNSQKLHEQWARFEYVESRRNGRQFTRKTPLWQLVGFAVAIIDTMRVWNDATQSRLPGYRDRIVTIPLKQDEGGLNLNMPSDRIEALSARGVDAAELLLAHFDVPSREAVMTWENHRWVRLRTFFASLEKLLAGVETSILYPENGDENYLDWVRLCRQLPSRQVCYEMDASQLADAERTLMELQRILHFWDSKSASLKAPKPPPELRPRAQI
jgi:predicted acylesterase/phospholipase RssA